MTPAEKESILKVIESGTIKQRGLLYLTHFAYCEASEPTPTMINNYFVDDPAYLKHFTSADRHPEGILTEEDQAELFLKIDKSHDRQVYYELRKLYAVVLWYKEQTERRLLRLHQDINILLNLLAPFNLIRTFADAGIDIGKAKRNHKNLTHLGLNKDLTPTPSHQEKVSQLVNNINIQIEEIVCYLTNLKEIATSRLPLKPIKLFANIEERLLKNQLVTLHDHLRYYAVHYLDFPQAQHQLPLIVKQPESVDYKATAEDIDCILKTEL